jgi:hypothetical protein
MCSQNSKTISTKNTTACSADRRNRKEYLMNFIKIAENNDNDSWFRDQVEMEEYKRIIKNPMYLSKMKENIDTYLININLFKDHFNLIFTNAFNYNKPKDKPYKDAERIQDVVNKILEKKWEKLIEKQDMTIEEQEHQKWVQDQIKKDPNFLDKSEDVVVPPKKFRYIPQKSSSKTAVQELKELNVEPNKVKLSEASVDQSDNESSVISGKLRKRKPNLKYAEDENYPGYSADVKMSVGNKSIESKSLTKKDSFVGKSKLKKNQEIQFSSDEDSEENNYTAKNLLKNPEELEEFDIKQYYDNPVRFCFDEPMLVFVPSCFL